MNNVSYAKPQETTNRKVNLLSTRGMTVMALLSAIAVVLMLFEVPLWFTPSFYKIDFSEVPVLIGAFALGPIAGMIIELIKILIYLFIYGTSSAFVGEVANYILGCALVVPAAIIYHRGRSKKSALIGMIVGTVAFIAAGCLLNAYLLLPTYAKLFQMPIDSLVAMGTAVNSHITNLNTFIFYAVAPFNLIKGVADSFLTILLYKNVSKVIKEFHR